MENNENSNTNVNETKQGFWKKLKLWQKVIIIIIVLAITVSVAKTCGSGNIDKVKNGHFKAYPDVTIGKAFNHFFGNPKWSSFVTDDDEQMVEFSGEATLGDEDVNVEIQFEVDKKSFEISWLGVDGETQPDSEIVDWLNAIYDEYKKNK